MQESLEEQLAEWSESTCIGKVLLEQVHLLHLIICYILLLYTYELCTFMWVCMCMYIYVGVYVSNIHWDSNQSVTIAS